MLNKDQNFKKEKKLLSFIEKKSHFFLGKKEN